MSQAHRPAGPRSIRTDDCHPGTRRASSRDRGSRTTRPLSRSGKRPLDRGPTIGRREGARRRRGMRKRRPGRSTAEEGRTSHGDRDADTLETCTTDTATPAIRTPDPLPPGAADRRAGRPGGFFASRLADPAPVLGAAGDPLIIGNTTNTAGTANTTLTTASTGTACWSPRTAAVRQSAARPWDRARSPASSPPPTEPGSVASPQIPTRTASSAPTTAARAAAARSAPMATPTRPRGHDRQCESGGGQGEQRRLGGWGCRDRRQRRQRGVQGYSDGNFGVSGWSQNSHGVEGFSVNSDGVVGGTNNNNGVHGNALAGGTGVLGTCVTAVSASTATRPPAPPATSRASARGQRQRRGQGLPDRPSRRPRRQGARAQLRRIRTSA